MPEQRRLIERPLGTGTVGLAVIQRCFEVGVPVILEMNALADIDASIAYLEAALEGGQVP